MADRDPMEELDQLLNITAVLRYLPRQTFRRSLAAELMRAARGPVNTAQDSEEKTMDTAAVTPVNPIREGFHTLTPYLVTSGAARLIDFLKQAFGAEERLRAPLPDGKIMHADMNIGGSMLELADGNAQYPPSAQTIHLYIEDVDAAYSRALEAGATSLHEPVNQPYGDREAGIQDPAGNHWYIATHLLPGNPEAKHIPAGLRAITPYLIVQGADQFIDFLKRALQAEEAGVYRSPEGTVVHAKIQIGDSMLELSEAHGIYQPMPANLHLYVEDTDAWYARAVTAGAESIQAPTDRPYGDRSAGVKDEFGNQWWFATHIRDVHF